jgi:hypothetical protein
MDDGRHVGIAGREAKATARVTCCNCYEYCRSVSNSELADFVAELA